MVRNTRLALLALCLTALAGCSLSRPSAATFLFPDELPILGHAQGHDHPTPLKSRRPTKWQPVGPAGDKIPAPTSEQLSETLRSELLTEMRSPGASSFEIPESSEDTTGNFLIQPEVDGSGLGHEQTIERPAETSAFSSDSTQILSTDLQEHPDSNATASSLDSDGVIVTDGSTLMRSGTLPGASSAPTGNSTPDPIPYTSSSHPDISVQTVTNSGSGSSSLNNARSQATTDGPRAWGGIFFPDTATGAEQHVPVRPLPSCDGKRVSAIHPATGLCQMLGLAGGCPDGQLFMLSPEGADPDCRPLPCPEDQLLVGDACRATDDPTACPPHRTLVRDERGRGRCDCLPGHVLWPADQRCYPALTQGPCPVGQQLTAPMDEPRPRCAENPCVRDGSRLWLRPPHAGCYELLNPTAGCESQLMLTLLNGRLVCDSLGPRSLFDLSTGCGDNHLQDYGGRCRNPLTQGFRG